MLQYGSLHRETHDRKIVKILFVSSGKEEGKPSVIVSNQGESLKKMGVSIDYFTVRGKGLKGYLRAIPELKQYVKESPPDIIHAHYSLSGFVTSFVTGIPKVVSLMGSDMYTGFFRSVLLKQFSLRIWSKVLLKSERLSQMLDIPGSIVIPNGVDMDHFIPDDKMRARQKLGLNNDLEIVLFGSGMKRPEKNYALAEQALRILKRDVHLLLLDDIDHCDVPVYMNAADVVLLTSVWEGSPNVIKEAMACSRPIVSTDVGDVSRVFGTLPGTYIVKSNPEDVARGISEALQFSLTHKRTGGRDRIQELGLESTTVSVSLISIYSEILKGKV